MVNAISVRNKVENKIFVALGSSALWSSYTNPSISKWGDQVEAWGTETSITIVPFYLMNNQQSFQDFGDLEAGEMDIALRYNDGVNVNDKITFNTKLYKVKAIENYILKDISLVNIARLKEFI